MSNNCTSKIKNEPKIKNKLIQAVRGQLEQRAAWLYLLCDEAGKEDLTGRTSEAPRSAAAVWDRGQSW